MQAPCLAELVAQIRNTRDAFRRHADYLDGVLADLVAGVGPDAAEAQEMVVVR